MPAHGCSLYTVYTTVLDNNSRFGNNASKMIFCICHGVKVYPAFNFTRGTISHKRKERFNHNEPDAVVIRDSNDDDDDYYPT